MDFICSYVLLNQNAMLRAKKTNKQKFSLDNNSNILYNQLVGFEKGGKEDTVCH